MVMFISLGLRDFRLQDAIRGLGFRVVGFRVWGVGFRV